MSAEEFPSFATALIFANVLLLVINAVMIARNWRIGQQHKEALRQLPRLVRAGEIIDAAPGERIALEIIVPPHSISLPQPPQPTHPAGDMVH